MDTEHASPHRGMIQVITGNGKGKTSIANGSAIRAVGAGLRVAIVSFDKGGDFYSERNTLERIEGIDLFPTGCIRFNTTTRTFRFVVEEEDKQEAERGLEIVRELFRRNEHDLVILDEVNTTTHLGMLNEADVLNLIASKPDSMELMMTGRNCPEAYMEIADLVSEVCDRKHYIRAGVSARKGFDY